jgi:mono/diheme cytochrome c family protein
MRQLLAALLAWPALAAAAGDAATGERLHRSCLQCHGTEVYKANAKIKSMAALRKETLRWADYYNPKFTKQELDDLLAYLNRDFYKLP